MNDLIPTTSYLRPKILLMLKFVKLHVTLPILNVLITKFDNSLGLDFQSAKKTLTLHSYVQNE